MTKKKEIIVEREYIINIREDLMKVPRYRRTPKAVKLIKEFIARHMRVVDRDLDKVKFSKWLNLELWHRGIQNPPTKIKVKAKKDGDIVLVDLVELPENMKYAKLREEKQKKESEKKKEKKKEEKEAKETKAEKDDKKEKEEKKEIEKEKEEAVKDAEMKQADLKAREQKHLQILKEPKIQRKALQK
ncbi:MAG TPA: 50S ribosomal protein L31e [Candidatus Paceibacterota bacterium]|nr:50S ribosomal protein L31e [Candidatus Paceibacterota bacterium]